MGFCQNPIDFLFVQNALEVAKHKTGRPPEQRRAFVANDFFYVDEFFHVQVGKDKSKNGF